MTAKPTERFSLARWSRRKLASALEKDSPAPASAPPPAVPAPAATALPNVELPAVESLTFDSDFTAFLQPGIDPTVKRAALKKLFRDPRFNVMDGLDVYIDDYTKADPIPPDMLSDLLDRFQRSTAPSSVAEAEEVGDETAAAREGPLPVTARSVTSSETESCRRSASAEEAARLSESSSPPTDAQPPGIAAEPLPARDPSSKSRRTEGQ